MQLDFVLGADQLHAIQFGSVVVPDEAALFWATGPGALDCLQGLLTSDLAAAPVNSLSYGAMLTGKGMIILDPLVLRRGDGFLLILPGTARATAMAHFRRTLPPRLARVEDRTEAWRVLWLLGNDSMKLAEEFDAVVPGSSVMPFKGMIADERSKIENAVNSLRQKRVGIGDPAHLAAARVLAGWPSLGREIDEKTFPQEVRFDELGAVSYSKGCYTGQETVARVHFRGHPNRQLRALVTHPIQEFDSRTVLMEGKEVGVLRTTVRTEERTIALATVRREVPEDAIVRIDDIEARLTSFPVSQGVTA